MKLCMRQETHPSSFIWPWLGGKEAGIIETILYEMYRTKTLNASSKPGKVVVLKKTCYMDRVFDVFIRNSESHRKSHLQIWSG